MIPGDSYQKFMPWQQGDFDEKARDLKWWQWSFYLFAFAMLVCRLGWSWLVEKGSR